MGMLDKVVAAVTPEASDEDRAEARGKARALSAGDDWLGMVLDHHEAIEAAFAAVRSASNESARRTAQENLAGLLTAHSIAEEAVLYPAMALTDQKSHATEAYTEQSAAKIQTAALDDLKPMSQDYLDKLEHLRAAVAHHVYEEESTWFPALWKTCDASKRAKLSGLYQEQFERYAGTVSA